MRNLVQSAIGVLLLVTAIGCSISESVSDSISSPFESSSASSSPEGRSESYQGDVRDYTIAYVRSGGDFGKFMNGLGGLAQKHGVTNWEADTNTFIGIGRGLKRAGVTPTQLEVYKTNLSLGDPHKAASMQKGFDQEK